jgi:hypothetical protein
MDLRPGEIRQAASMFRVQMSQHYVTDIFAPVAEGRDLSS